MAIRQSDREVSSGKSKNKRITSLSFFSILEKNKSSQFASRCNEVVEKAGYAVPEVELIKLKDGTVKCAFDFTDYFNPNEVYWVAVSNFMLAYEQFICELLSLDDSVTFNLSALLDVDERLATFEVRSPSIPASISKFPGFSFDYWIWHTKASARTTRNGARRRAPSSS